MTFLIWPCRNVIIGSVCGLLKPVLASTSCDKYPRVLASGTGIVESPAFSSARMYGLREFRFGGGHSSFAYCGGILLAPQSLRYSRFGPALDFMLTTNNRLPSALTDTELGYHPVGIRPSTCCEATSMTATAFSPPSVT